MQKVEYTGYNRIYGNMNSTVTPVNNSDLPTVVNGFNFLGSACNPCVALSDPANYSCPFSLNTGNGSDVSPVWQKLWKVNADGSPFTESGSSSTLKPDVISSTFNKNDFPLLNQLKDELLKSASMIDVSFKKPPTILNGNRNDNGNGNGNDKKISAITGSSVPAIVDNHSLPSNTINYTTRNAF